MVEYALGIDIGGTNIKAALVDKEGRTKDFRSIPTDKGKNPQFILRQLLDIITVIKKGIEKGSNLVGIGLALPGSVDASTGICLYSPNLGWKNVEVVEPLKNLSGLEVRLLNDANAACLGEYLFGAGRGSSNFICITIGTGIGTAFILENKLFLGRSGFAGEAGHMVIDPDGPPCSCGRKGCWEALVSASAILSRTKEQICSQLSAGVRGVLNQDDAFVSTKTIVEAAQSGNGLALRILEETREYLALGLANLVNIFNPERIVLAGGVAAAKGILFDDLEERVKDVVFPDFRPGLQIKLSELGNLAGVAGAASLWFKQIETIEG